VLCVVRSGAACASSWCCVSVPPLTTMRLGPTRTSSCMKDPDLQKRIKHGAATRAWRTRASARDDDCPLPACADSEWRASRHPFPHAHAAGDHQRAGDCTSNAGSGGGWRQRGRQRWTRTRRLDGSARGRLQRWGAPLKISPCRRGSSSARPAAILCNRELQQPPSSTICIVVTHRRCR